MKSKQKIHDFGPPPLKSRVRIGRAGNVDSDGSCVLYWMQRSQRALDNPALDWAIDRANQLGKPALAIFGLTADYPGAERRHYRFMLEALPEIRQAMLERGVPLIVRLGGPDEVVERITAEIRPALVVGDENPVRIGQLWRDRLIKNLNVPLEFVDSDVIVPMSHFTKEEYAARTIRPKIHAVWESYLAQTSQAAPCAKTTWNTQLIPKGELVDPAGLLTKLKVKGAPDVSGLQGGTKEALSLLDRFVRERLEKYGDDRNEPTPCVTSELSAHLHFGHISPLTIARAVRARSEAEPSLKASADVYLEELIVRRELAINYVAHNPNYDRLEGCPSWALQTLEKHRSDPRPYLYSKDVLERAETHDPIWNAAQLEMVLTGRMHNYLRMYWAKKILEWTPNAATAFEIAVELNDRYEMDGRDPNGYAGIAWAIGGKHDRPWPERPIFGTVRFMSYDGLRKKLDADSYVARINALKQRQTS